MPSPTLADRHAAIGRALAEKEKRLGWMRGAIAHGHLAAAPDTVSPIELAEDYAALLAFARAEWIRADQLLEWHYDGCVDEILSRLESALAPLPEER